MTDVQGSLNARMAQIMAIIDGSGADQVGDMWDDMVSTATETPAGEETQTREPAGGSVGAAVEGAEPGQLNATLQERLNKLFAAAPGKVSIVSGFRTRAQQEALYAKYKAGTGNLAAKPGTSNHERGAAADLGYASAAVQEWVLAHAAEFGLAFPIAGEPWHAELAGSRG